MNNFKENDNVYLIDGTIENLFTLIDNYIYIKSDLKCAKSVIKIINDKLSKDILKTVYIALLSKTSDKYKIIYDYIYYAFKYGTNIKYYRNLSCVINIEKIVKNIKRETHKFKGFVRFTKVNDDVYFSKIKPDNDILLLLSNHFKNRFKNEKWIIIDEKRNKGVFYSNGNLDVIYNIEKFNVELADEKYVKLWKQFYNSVTIKI